MARKKRDRSGSNSDGNEDSPTSKDSKTKKSPSPKKRSLWHSMSGLFTRQHDKKKKNRDSGRKSHADDDSGSLSNLLRRPKYKRRKRESPSPAAPRALEENEPNEFDWNADEVTDLINSSRQSPPKSDRLPVTGNRPPAPPAPPTIRLRQATPARFTGVTPNAGALGAPAGPTMAPRQFLGVTPAEATQMRVAPSPTMAPGQMVNATPAEAPQIRPWRSPGYPYWVGGARMDSPRGFPTVTVIPGPPPPTRYAFLPSPYVHTPHAGPMCNCPAHVHAAAIAHARSPLAHQPVYVAFPQAAVGSPNVLQPPYGHNVIQQQGNAEQICNCPAHLQARAEAMAQAAQGAGVVQAAPPTRVVAMQPDVTQMAPYSSSNFYAMKVIRTDRGFPIVRYYPKDYAELVTKNVTTARRAQVKASTDETCVNTGPQLQPLAQGRNIPKVWNPKKLIFERRRF